jgi:hypothetical protein
VAAFSGILGRRPSTEESQRYAGFLQASLKSLTAEKAIEQLLVAILFHPELMYRIELPESGATRTMIPPRDLARAISFALTDREPDATLLKAVADGRLSKREEVRAGRPNPQ